jgi:hypothetical protein
MIGSERVSHVIDAEKVCNQHVPTFGGFYWPSEKQTKKEKKEKKE